MIEPIKAIGTMQVVNLSGVERVRERIAEIEKRFGIAGENSFQATLEREMKKAQRADKNQAAQGTAHKSNNVGTVERAADAVGAANIQRAPESADALREAELVSEYDAIEEALTEEPELKSTELTGAIPNNVFEQLPGEEALNPFAEAAAIENVEPTRDTIREPLVPVVNGAFEDVAQTTEELIEAAAEKYSVDPNLVKALATAESDWDQNAISPVGAIGVMQLMPETARSLGVNPYDEQENIEGGTKYLRQMLDTFNGNVRKAVAAYNAGPGAVARYGGVPPYSETQNYVGRVLDLYE